MPKRRRHAGRHGSQDASNAYGGESEGEGFQMPPSSQMSYYDPNSLRLPPRPRSPPRAPQAMREQLRSPPPPPLPQSPSPSYIALAGQAPSRMDGSSPLRKLLVLDLNGTLLHRSPNTTRPKYHERTRDAQGNLHPRLRPVHPRPYMSAFRSYLFSPQTRAWLDVMVWSSAQPHSVGDMVDKCFGDDKGNMVAVWARDTLGLSNDQYFRKVQTVKDLTKPWAALSPQQANPASPHPSIASTPPSSPPPSSPSRPSDGSAFAVADGSSQAHSALTTLLLDDSPLKAGLQPFNHVCIGEYTGELRAKDVEGLQKMQEWQAAIEARQELDAAMNENDAQTPTAIIDSANGSPIDGCDDAAMSPDEARSTEGDAELSKKRKRKQKKLLKRAARLEEVENTGKPEVSFDETLLAVIGALDEIKVQTNVAAWIRTGGLWGPHGPPITHMPGASSPAIGDVPREGDGSRSDDSTLSVDRGVDRSSKADRKSAKREKKRRRLRGPSQEGQTEEATAIPGNDEHTVVSTDQAKTREDGVESEPGVQAMWFENTDVLAYWTERGRKALDELEIPIEHGVER